MNSTQDEIRKTAANLLNEGKADLVIGFAEGTLPMTATPCFITKAEDAERLVWNSFCSNNLAVYLPRCFAPEPRPKEPPPPPRVAVFVKGCDGRALVGLIKEQQLPRENVIIIALPCRGMLDAAVAQRLLGTDEIAAAQEADATVTITDESGSKKEFSRDELLAEACRYCGHHAAVVYDMTVGELPVDEGRPAADDPVEAFSQKPAAQRWEQFCREVSKCILCKACRSACPNCYCKVCFADHTRPRWIGAGNELRDAVFYHLGRMFHQAGRCVDCGACVRACPMGIDLRIFTYGLVKDARESFGYTPGLDLDEVPLLRGFGDDDPEGFITDPE